MTLPSNILSMLGSPIKRSRQEGIRLCLSEFSTNVNELSEELLELADSNNVFHAISAVKLSIQFSKIAWLGNAAGYGERYAGHLRAGTELYQAGLRAQVHAGRRHREVPARQAGDQ